jgi:hypothetical protein
MSPTTSYMLILTVSFLLSIKVPRQCWRIALQLAPCDSLRLRLRSTTVKNEQFKQRVVIYSTLKYLKELFKFLQ